MKNINIIKNITTLFDMFSIKTGKIIKVEKKCYQVNKWISLFHKVYYSGPIYLLMVVLYLALPHIFTNIYIQMVETLLIFIVMEIVIFLIVPFTEVPCWQKNLQDKHSMNIGGD